MSHLMPIGEFEKSWDEDLAWDGRNYVSRNTGKTHAHQTLYRKAAGEYLLEDWSDRVDVPSRLYPIEKAWAARWLSLNDHRIPADLR